MLLLLLRLFPLSVGRCLPGEQEGDQSEREPEGDTEGGWSLLYFILAALLLSVWLVDTL